MDLKRTAEPGLLIAVVLWPGWGWAEDIAATANRPNVVVLLSDDQGFVVRVDSSPTAQVRTGFVAGLTGTLLRKQYWLSL
jgi:hypothetical protein